LPAVQIAELNNSNKNLYFIRNRQTLAGTLAQIVKEKIASSDSKNFQLKQQTLLKAKNSSEVKCKKPAYLPKLPQLT